MFDLQDKVTERVVGVIEPSVQRSEIERSRRKRPGNLKLTTMALRALPHIASAMPADAKIAMDFLGDALRLDPNYAAAHAHLAHCHEIGFMRAGFDQGGQNSRAPARASRDLQRNRRCDGTCDGRLRDQQPERGSQRVVGRDGVRALSINPSCATALYYSAVLNGIASNFVSANTHAERALRLSPFDPFLSLAHLTFAFAPFSEARYSEAAAHYAKAVQANPHFSLCYFDQAIALALAGQLDEARPIARRGLELEPGFQTRAYAAFGLGPEILDKFLQGGRLLGFPE